MKKETELDVYFYITGWICIGVMLLIAGMVCIFGEKVLDLIPNCFFHAFTGYYCPGCGGTRATFALLHGDILKSLFYHPFVGYVATVGGWFMLSQTVEYLSKGKLSVALHFRQVYMWIGIFLIVLNCLVKNVVKFLWGIPLMA